LVGLEYIHEQCILHRDIKPENLVFDSNGYLRITDFGIAKKYVVNNKKDTSGTVGYLAPEILCNQNHTYSIDYYAVGIIAYELAYGHRPYIGRSKHEVKQLILTQQAHIDYDELPNGYHDPAADFINKLLDKNEENRLGYKNINELKCHPWLKYTDWKNIYLMKEKPPFVPPRKVICSEENITENENAQKKIDNSKITNGELYKTAFVKFEYFNKFSKKFQSELLKFINPHSFYDEIDKKEKELKIVHKMDEEQKKKRGDTLSPNNLIAKKENNQNNLIKLVRKNTYQLYDEEYPGPRININPIKLSFRKQSIA